MQIGLFGKIPAKGDFLTRNVPPEVLQFWEGWLEKVVGGAKHHLGGNWHNTYMAAPVWRFWIGDTVFGHPVAGVLSPAVDRVGRQFPITLILSGAGGQHPASPLAGDGNEQWYATLDQACLAALAEGFNGDVDALIKQIPMPNGPVQAQAEDRRQAFFAYGESGLGPMLQDVRDHDHQLSTQGRSYWWTAGNAYVGPAIIALNGMPDAAGFAAMLAGFGPPPQNVLPTTAPAPEVPAAAAMAPAAMAPQQPAPPVSDPWGIDPNDAGSWDPAPPPPTPEPAVPFSNPWASASEDLGEFEEDEQSPFDTDNGWAVPMTPEPRKDTTLPPQATRPARQVTGIEDESPLGPDGRLLAPDPIEESAPEPVVVEAEAPETETTVPPKDTQTTDTDDVDEIAPAEELEDDTVAEVDEDTDDATADIEDEAAPDYLTATETSDYDAIEAEDAEFAEDVTEDTADDNTLTDDALTDDEIETADPDIASDTYVSNENDTSDVDAPDGDTSENEAVDNATSEDDTPEDEAAGDARNDSADDTADEEPDGSDDTDTTKQDLTEEETTTKARTDETDLPGEEPDKAAADDVLDDLPEGDESPFATADKPEDEKSGQKRGSRLRGLFSRRDR